MTTEEIVTIIVTVKTAIIAILGVWFGERIYNKGKNCYDNRKKARKDRNTKKDK